MGFVTIRDVARKAGVSITAVSQILHGKGRFSKETRDLVHRTVKDLGYIPDSRAQAIRSSKSRTVGLLVPDLRNPFFADLVCAMEEELYTRGYGTLIGTSAEDVKRQDAFITTLLGQRIDGAIVVPQGVESPGIRAVMDRKLPLVFVDRRLQGVDNIPYVISDPYEGLREALTTLQHLGHRRIGYVAHSSLGSFSINEREAAFRTIANDLFDPSNLIIVDCSKTTDTRRYAFDQLIAAKVTAMVFAYSPDAIAMVGLLHDRGLTIGADVSVVSFDDIEAFRLMTPQVSIISQQVGDMGRQGVDMLLTRIGTKDRQPPEGRSIPTVFVQRGSVSAAPTA